MNIQQMMEKIYKDKYPGLPPITEMVSRNEPNKAKDNFRLFMTEKRQEYIKMQNKELEKSVKRSCVLCHSYQAIIYDDHLILTPDDFPMYDYHILIIPLKKGIVLDSELVDNSYRLAYITKDVLACREYLIKEDIDAEVNLVKNTDYMVMQSMRGSGASVPEHVHAHAFKRNLMKFPLLNENNFLTLYSTSNVEIKKIDTPSYGFLIQGDSSQYGAIIDGFHKSIGLPFNLLITEFAQNIAALFFPRIREVPVDPIFEGWQFGVTEMIGLFEAKTYEQFHNLTYKELCQGLKETTVQNRVMQNRIEESLIQIIKNV